MKDEINGRLQNLNAIWEQLQSVVTPEAEMENADKMLRGKQS